MCFPVNIAKFLRTPILKNICNDCFWTCKEEDIDFFSLNLKSSRLPEFQLPFPLCHAPRAFSISLHLAVSQTESESNSRVRYSTFTILVSLTSSKISFLNQAGVFLLMMFFSWRENVWAINFSTFVYIKIYLDGKVINLRNKAWNNLFNMTEPDV